MYSLSSSTNQSWLSWFLRGFLILLFLVLFVKLFEVQIIKGKYYRALAEENRIHHIVLPAPRGKILASAGEALADNVNIKKRVVVSSAAGITLSEDLTGAKEDEIITVYKRAYPLGSKFGHASGYLAPIKEEEVGTVDPDCPEKGVRVVGTIVGLTGLEEEYECLLRGIPGEKLMEVDTTGKEIRVLAIKNPVPGTDLKTSIDYNLQEKLSNYMDKKGAAIVSAPGGQVIAFYSYPSYDPNLFIDRQDQDPKVNALQIATLLKNPDLPLFNRVTSGVYHPGSVFKPLVALAALEEGAIDSSFNYTDTGQISVNTFSYTNWYFTEYGKTEGLIDLNRALARSTDTFFYKVGEMVGPVNIAKWSGLFDLDKTTGIDLPGEIKGLIPTPEWKKKTIKEPWFLGNTYNMSIGQGDVSVTPVELNTYISALAQDGKLCKPSFIIRDTPLCRQINVNKKNIDLVKEGMISACSEGGTAFTFFDFTKKHEGTSVACKTGTAEVGSDGIPHAWFTVFSPADKPKVVATVIFEKAGQGSQVAGPVARKILDYYYDRTD
jgi:penicillin-binding protein 2